MRFLSAVLFGVLVACASAAAQPHARGNPEPNPDYYRTQPVVPVNPAAALPRLDYPGEATAYSIPIGMKLSRYYGHDHDYGHGHGHGHHDHHHDHHHHHHHNNHNLDLPFRPADDNPRFDIYGY